MSQVRTTEAPGRITPVDEFVNTLEVEAMAQRKLAPGLFEEIAGSNRYSFDRITFRPRMLVDTTKLDLSLDLFGQRHFAPILIGPAGQQQRFHPEGELAMARGANAAKAGLVVGGQSSYSFEKIAPLTQQPLWAQLSDPNQIPSSAKVICLSAPLDWARVDQFRKAVNVPLVIKGIMTAQDARTAIEHGASGIVVSSYRPSGSAQGGALDVLPEIVRAVGRRVPILIDGSFRRGGDILKALALGATAALVTRPALWGLATYGDRGVQQVLEMLQSEIARDMAMLGLANLSQISPAFIRMHKR